MKKLFLFSCILLFSCNNKIHYDGQEFDNYDQYVEYSINQLKSPVVITNIRSKFYSSDTIYSIGYLTYYGLMNKNYKQLNLNN